MSCNECGEKPKRACGAFPKAVIEIDNPEKITLLRKVIIPASMGDDTTVPPTIGKYHNVLLNYEANNRSYLYSSDGIPTLLTGEHGEQGPAGTVTVGTTTTGEPGSSASVENVGTPENAVLNFTVPQGPRVPEEEVQEDVNNKLDDMVEDGTLQDIVDSYLDTLTRKVEYIFPKNWNAFSGDVGIIRGYGKVIMIDTFINSNKNELYQMLEDFGITHIDYLILSHYHGDHIGNVINLINDGYVDSSSYIYMPPDCQQIVDSAELTATKNAIVLAVTQAQIPNSIPVENSKLTINEEFEIEFYNTDYSALSNYTNYNNCSTLCMVNHSGKKSLYTADALGQALDRALANGFTGGHIDLYKVEHHGIEYNNAAVDTLLATLPTYAYCPSFVKSAETNEYSMSTTLAFLKSKDCKVYASNLSPEYIVFQSAFGNMSVINGKEAVSISNNNYLGDVVDHNVDLIYVDASTTQSVQNGTTTYPYKDLPQAIGACMNRKSGRVEIALRAGTYCFAHSSYAPKNNPLANNIDVYITKTSNATVDNVIIQGSCDFYNSNVYIKNVTFANDETHDYCLRFVNCNAELDNVKFNGATRLAVEPSNTTGIKSTNSKLYLHGCNIVSYNYFFAGYQDIIDIKDNVFNTVSIAVMSRGGIILGTGNTYTSVTNPYAINEGSIASCYLKSVYDGSATSGSISFKRSVTSFNKLTVISGDTSSGTLSTNTVFSALPNNFQGSTTYTARTVDGYYTLAIASNGRSATITAHNTTAPIKTILGESVNLEAI